MKKSTPLVLSWVHSLDDYRRMFNLDDKDLAKNILDYPAGLSSFNAEMHALGRQVVSADFCYNLSNAEMAEHADRLIRSLGDHLDEYADRIQGDWSEVLPTWQSCAQDFLDDYAEGASEGRYQHARLPQLPFQEKQFDLALCSDLSFRMMQREKAEDLIAELCRVAEEVRVFPLLDASGNVASVLGPLMLSLQEENYGVEISEVPYQFLKGGNAMLRIWTKECAVSAS